MSGHTPGPWEVYALLSASENDKGFRVHAHDGRDGRMWIADVSPVIKDDRGDASEEGKANARLIVAAPELYEAGRRILDGCDRGVDSDELSRRLRVLHAAILKAEGK